MELKYTKGEWKIMVASFLSPPEEIITGVGIELEPNYFRVLFNTIIPDSDEEYIKEHEEVKANTKLIAAAPDLLEALISAVPYIEQWALDTVKDKVNKAIKKATK